MVKLEDVEDGARGVAHEEDDDDGEQDPAMKVIFRALALHTFALSFPNILLPLQFAKVCILPTMTN